MNEATESALEAWVRSTVEQGHDQDIPDDESEDE